MHFNCMDNIIYRIRAMFSRHGLYFMLLLFACCHSVLAENVIKPDNVILQLKWKHQFQFAGYYAAIEKGYYKDAGLDVTLVEASPGVDPAEAVLSGKADFGIAGSSLVVLRDKGNPVVVLAAIFQHSPLVIMTKDDGIPADVRSLIGKKVMIEPLSAEVLAYLQIEGIEINSLKIQPHTFKVKDLINGKVDAMTAYTTTEPYHLRKLKIPYKLFQPYTCGIDFYGDSLFTTENQIKLYPERVKAFREASLRGWKYAMDHPAEMIALIRRKYNPEISQEQLQFEAIEMRSLINPNVIEIGYMNLDRWRNIVATYNKIGQISKRIPLDKFIYSTTPPASHYKPYYVAIILLALLAAGVGVVAMRFRKLNLILKNEIELRDHAEQELKETRTIFEAAFDQSPAGIIIAGAPDGQIRYFNKSAHQILCCPEDEAIVGMAVNQFTPGDQLLYLDGTRVKPEEGPLARAVLHGESSSKEFISRPDGQEQRIVWTKAAPIRDENGVIKAGIAIVLDITERKQAQLALQESEKRFQTMADTAPILLWMSGRDGLYTYFNHRWLEFTGHTLVRELSNGWSECVHPEDRQHCLYTRAMTLNTRQPFAIEYRLRHNSGEYRWILDYGVPRFNADGDFLGYIGTGTDITERKQAEDALRESEIRFRSYFELPLCGIAITSPEKGWLHVNNSLCDMLGYTADELSGLTWAELTHPDDLDADISQFNRLLAGEIDSYSLEKRFIRKNGEIVFASLSAGCVRKPDRSVNYVVAVIQDISNRKMAEKALSESENRYKSITENAFDMIALLDLDGHYVYCNNSYMDILGYRPDDMTAGRCCFDIIHPDDKAETIQLFQDYLAGKVNIGYLSIRLLCSNGACKWVEHRARILADENGKPQHVLLNARDVTERKQADDALQEVTERLRFALEGTNDGIWDVQMDTGKTYLSPRSNEILGYGPDDAIAVKNWSDLIYPDDLEQTRIDLSAYLEGRKPLFSTEQRLKTKDGNWKWILTRGKAVAWDSAGKPLRMTGTHTDITERKQADDALKASEMRFNQLAEQSRTIVWEVDAKGLYTYVSRVTEQVIGYQPEELIGKKFFYDLHPEAERETLKAAAFNVFERREKFVGLENTVQTKNGQIIWFSTNGIPIIGADGELLGYRGADTDINERKMNEYELVKAKEKAEESNRLKSAFMRNMSHEIRTPMNAIMGFSDLMQAADGDEKNYFADIILKSSEQLLMVIDDVILLSRLQSEKLPLNNIGFKPAELTTDIIRMFFLPDLKKELKLTLNIPAQYKDLVVRADGDKIKQILINLVSNAIKYTLKGGVEAGFDMVNAACIEFYVEDTGIGIPEKEHKRIFDTFCRGEEVISSAIRGTGLGLSIAKELVELLGGEIGVNSTPGKGSRFHFTVPVETSDKAQPKITSDIDIKYDWKDAIILIAEDEIINYRYLEVLLKDKVQRIDHAINGLEAVEMASKNNYALVLMDLKMPLMDGIEATRIIKQQFPKMPVIAQTAYAMPEEKNAAIQAGCDEFISKPIKKDALMALISKILG